MTFDFYAFWNGTQVADVLTAVVGMVGTGSYHAAMMSVAILGFLTAVATAAVRNRGGDVVVWFFATVLFFYVSFGERASVIVHDLRAGTVRVVENVPFGVAFVGSTSSQLGAWAAELFETAFADVDAARFTKFGAVFPERAAAALAAAGPVLPETKAILDPFVESCLTPEVLDHPAKLTELMNSPDLAATIRSSGWLNPARFILKDGAPLYCPEAFSALETQITTNEIPAQEKLLAARLTSSDGTASDSFLTVQLKKAIPDAQALMLGVSRSMEESLRHSVLLSEIPKGISRYAGRMSPESSSYAAAVQLSKSQASMASEISFRTMAELAKSFLPKLRNLLEGILIASFPLVFLILAALGDKAGNVIRMYAVLFVWLALWAPLAAVMNYFAIHMDASPASRIIEHYGGLTLASASAIRELGVSSQSMAGYLMMLVPLIAYLIAKASDMGAVSLASSVLSPAASAGQAISSQAAMGNISSGQHSQSNTTFGSTTTGKTDLTSRYAGPDIRQTATAYGAYTQDAGTGRVTGMTLTPDDVGVAGTASYGHAVSSETSTGSVNSFTRSDAVSWGATNASMTSSGTSYASTNARAGTFSSSSAATQSAGTSTSAGESIAVDSSASVGRNAGVSEGLKLDSGLGIRASSVGMDITSPTSGPEAPKSSVPMPSNEQISDVTGTPNGMGSIVVNGTTPSGISSTSSGPGTFGMPSTPMLQASNTSNAPRTAGRSGTVKDAAMQWLTTPHAELKAGVQTGVNHGDSTSSTFRGATASNWQSSEEIAHRNTETTQKASSSSTSAQLETRGGVQQTNGESVEMRASGSSMRANSEGNRNVESRNGSAGATVNLATMARQELLELYGGNPEAALRAMQNPGFRASFGRHIESKLRHSGMADATIQGPHTDLAILDGPSRMHDAAESYRDEMAGRHDTALNDVQAAGEERLSQVSAPAQTSPEPLGTLNAARETAALGAGITRVVAASFDANEISMKSLISVGVLGGTTYESPQEMFSALNEAASRDPELREKLINAGSGHHDNEAIVKLFK